jgi:Zn-dependent protease
MAVTAVFVFVFLMTVVIHEVSHGFVAYCLGDSTAKRAGRLSLNPLRHIDPFWTVILPVMFFVTTGGRFAIGMAKPVPVNFSMLRNPRRDMIFVALAGPLANIILADLLSVLFHMTQSPLVLTVLWFNLGLAMFNLIPIPPLDGSRILAGLLPRKWAEFFFIIEPFGFLITMVLYFSGFLFYLIVPGVDFFCRLMEVPALPVHF